MSLNAEARLDKNLSGNVLCARETAILLLPLPSPQLRLQRKVKLQLGVALKIDHRFRPTGKLFGKEAKETRMRSCLPLSLVPGFCTYGPNITVLEALHLRKNQAPSLKSASLSAEYRQWEAEL